MATIDTSTIEGYAEMSAEEKIAALEGFEFESQPTDNGEIDKLKRLLSKANGEAADFKRKYRDTLSESEQKALEQAEAQKALEEKVASYERKDKISDAYKEFVGIGYTSELAEKAATARVDGDFAAEMSAMKEFVSGFAQKVKAEFVKDTPKPTPGKVDNGVMTKESLAKMTLEERGEWASAHPDEYKAMYS